ncbi:hypothetical protein CGMCC3_g6354 [Colletotrichum fructicola]|nr:uncharacterized protein CGMCC3_g6354 [Colletotrichum fructicola]KAE9577610.1 hypothetical protein CGMCC3_g6354 [Colletotrichum fructicola]
MASLDSPSAASPGGEPPVIRRNLATKKSVTVN